MKLIRYINNALELFRDEFNNAKTKKAGSRLSI